MPGHMRMCPLTRPGGCRLGRGTLDGLLHTCRAQARCQSAAFHTPTDTDGSECDRQRHRHSVCVCVCARACVCVSVCVSVVWVINV